MNVTIETSWKKELEDEFTKPYFESLVEFVKNEYISRPGAIFPKGSQIFRAFEACTFENVKVVILGQDPYPTRGHAHGLCFSVEPDVRPLPKSLNNIYKELQSDLGIHPRESGDLNFWAEQGVLLLNATLTVREGQPESHAGKGWELFTDAVINTLNEHLSYITVRGARKRDHPQSFSYHEPWWSAYHVMASYFTRLSMVLSQGEQVNTVLLIEPTTTAWMYQGDSTHRGHLGKIGSEFQNTVVALSKAQVEYDIGCEDVIARHGSVQGGILKIGRRGYETVVLPPTTENLNAKTMAFFED